MASAPAPGGAPKSDLHGFKADLRGERMKMSNTLHDRIFSEWQKMAVKACDDDVRAYWVCRQEAGLAVVLRCREHNDRMQNCIADYTRDADAFARYKDRRMSEMADDYAKRRAERVASAAGGAAAGAPNP